MQRIMLSGASLPQVARELVVAANAAGGDDNVTAIVFRIGDGPTDGARRDQRAGACTSPTSRLRRPSRRREQASHFRRAFLLALLVFLLLLAAAVLGVVGLRWAHFVGASDCGRVAVYQGVPLDLGAGLRLYRQVDSSPVLVATLTRDGARGAVRPRDRVAGRGAAARRPHRARRAVGPPARPARRPTRARRSRPLLDRAALPAAQPRARHARPGGPALTAAGFGAVFAARENEVSTASLSYAAFFFALYLVAHLVLRLALPEADPSLLPLVAPLTAIGEIEIYRIDPELARDQGLWIAVGRGAVRRRLLRSGRDLARLENLRYTCRRHGAAAARADARARHRGQRRAAVDPHRRLPDPARRVREGAAGGVPGRLPARPPRGAGAARRARSCASASRPCATPCRCS